MKLSEFDGASESEEVVLMFQNKPSQRAPRFLFENRSDSLEEGKTKNWRDGYRYRLDRRPAHMGGDQVHIWAPNGQKWAYRSSGSKSEPGKYNSPATMVAKDIVSSIFGIDRSDIEEALILRADKEEILIEIIFA